MPRPAGFVLPTLGEVRTRTVTIEDKDLDRALDMALLHGDLWSGNYLEAGDEPVVFDPAVYYGEWRWRLRIWSGSGLSDASAGGVRGGLPLAAGLPKAPHAASALSPPEPPQPFWRFVRE